MGVVAVLVSILVPLVSRRRKKLFFDVLCEAYLIERKSGTEAEGSEEQSKRTPVLFVIDLRNPLWGIFNWLGGLDISPEQYERRISFTFGENARILEADVVKEKPQGIGADAIANHFPSEKLILKPTLLNQGDSIRLRVVVENPDLAPSPSFWPAFFFGMPSHFAVKVEGRILGVRKIQRKRSTHELTASGATLLQLGILPVAIVFVPGLLVWLFTGSTDLMGAAPLPWFAGTVPETLLDPLSLLTGTQTTLCFMGQFFLLLGGWRRSRAYKYARQYSPASSHPLTLF